MNKEPLQIKVCGMRDPQNLEQVCGLAPEFIGYIFYAGSKRFIGKNPDPALFSIPGPGIKKVGVFVNEDPGQVRKCIEFHQLDVVQLHGNEDADYCRSLAPEGVQLIKVLDPFGSDPDSGVYEGVVDFFLFDSAGPGRGGTGEKFDWNVLEDKPLSAPFLLSGGIGPGDATQLRLIAFPGMMGVDVNSRFEVTPGLKDVKALKAFFNHIRK